MGREKVQIDIEEELYVEKLTAYVEQKLRKEVWDKEDEEKVPLSTKPSKQQGFIKQYVRNNQLKKMVITERERLKMEQEKELDERRRKGFENIIQTTKEQKIRVEELNETIKCIKQLKNIYLEDERKEMEETEWIEYMNCDHLPNPSDCGQMHIYLQLWDQVKDQDTLKETIRRTDEIFYLLDNLENFIDNQAVNEQKHNSWIEVQHLFYKAQQKNLDHAAYTLLRNIDKYIDNNDVKESYYAHEHKYFTMCLWVLLQKAIPLHNPYRPKRKREYLTFPEISMKVLFPEKIDTWALAVRCMQLPYDHFSCLSRSFQDPNIPPLMNMDLNESTQIEWEQREEISKILFPVDYVRNEIKRPLLPNEIATMERPKTVSETYVQKEDKLFYEIKDQFYRILDDFEVDLRNYTFIGGVYFLELFYQPPQPANLVLRDINIAALTKPRWLKQVPFMYKKLNVHKQTYSEYILSYDGALEKAVELNKHIYIKLNLTDKVVWLHKPVVCCWDEIQKYWTTEHIRDVNYNSERNRITFYTSKFGIFGLAMNKYINMPYKGWDIRPIPDSKIVLKIYGKKLTIEFTIDNNKVCVSNIWNVPNNSINYLIGKYYKLYKLIRLLKLGGVDFFPEIDGFQYTSDSSEKHWAMERHLYYNMAQSCLYFNYARSRWNAEAGRRTVVMQMREMVMPNKLHVHHQPNFSTLMVTPLKALVVNCTELSSTFTDEPFTYLKFFPDLIHLIYGSQCAYLKKKIPRTSPQLINTVANILFKTRIVSFS